MVRLVTLYLQGKPADIESWQAQLTELKSFLWAMAKTESVRS